jgi:VIT1/CCC1 family predicted Fe2+/Mn2+ transporter
MPRHVVDHLTPFARARQRLPLLPPPRLPLSETIQMATAPSPGHFVTRLGWLRAAVLGANDGLLSTASLMIGVASAAASHEAIVVAGLAGLVAGAMSMAAGEYVSVSSQSDSEAADIARERHELLTIVRANCMS